MELKIDDLDFFLSRNRISKEDWGKANIEFEMLLSIFSDYNKSVPYLNEAAEFIAKVLQKCPQVHSVRWRVKEPEHLLEKIIRKRAAGSPKYLEIGVGNYSEIITDLVGVRVLHLFKYEWKDIHSYILNSWEPLENVKAYIRKGDESDVVESYERNNCDVEFHGSGYRSIHYIISTKPTLKNVVSEIQVRTIFEEGWSEIDHKVRYPNFSDNKLISYFLTIFNRLAGSADEMGTFVKDLTAEMSLQEIKNAEVQGRNEEHLSKIEALIIELNEQKTQNQSKDESLDELTEEIKQLRKSTTVTISNSNRVSSLLSGMGYSEQLISARAAMDMTKFENNSLDQLVNAAQIAMQTNGLEHFKDLQSKINALSIGDKLLQESIVKIANVNTPINKKDDEAK